MYTNCQENLLLEWKIVTDQDAERYLLQSFLKKERWKGPEANMLNPGHGKNFKHVIRPNSLVTGKGRKTHLREGTGNTGSATSHKRQQEIKGGTEKIKGFMKN